MLKSSKIWDVQQVDDEAVQELAQAAHCSELIARLLYNRGITTPESVQSFLHSEKVPYHDPYLMLGMEAAVERLSEAIENEENILVFGDYDADGVTSTSLLVLALRELGAQVTYYIPDRFKEGYGPNIPAIDKAKSNGVSLVVTVDTGISAVSVAAHAKSIGLDYIVTDHHEPPPELPDAYAIVNPKQPGCTYPFKGLCGAGVAIKLVQALFDEMPTHLLDLAAVGTIADLVPLEDENRRIVKEGLQVLSQQPKPGLKALLQVSGHTPGQKVDSELVGFQLGPRLNAAGRLKHASLSADLLMAEDWTEALSLAEQVDQMNLERKAYVDTISEEAQKMVEQFPEDERDFIIVANPDWHEGVLGIVASRLVEQYYRPTLVLSVNPETGMAKGSARSIEGFDVFQALSTCRDLLPHFGGHEMAAGLSLPFEQVTELRERMNRYSRQVFTEEMLVPRLRVDARLPLEAISLGLIEEMAVLEPFGEGNPKPKFVLENVMIKEMKPIGALHNHLKLQLTDSKEQLEAISFGKGFLASQMTGDARLSVAGQLGINEWNGFRKPQLFIDDFSIKEWQLFDLRGSNQWLETLRGVITQTDVHAVYFREETYQSLPPALIQARSVEAYKEEQLSSSSLVLLDLPESLEQLSEFLANMDFPDRIYLVFDQKEDSLLEGVPSREQFKQAYALFYKYPNVTVAKLRQWAQYKRWSISQMDFIIKVFLELEFVKIEQNALVPVQTSVKRPLTDSRLYQDRLNQAEVEEFLLYSPRQAVKDWFDQQKVDRHVAKEDVLL